MTSSTVVRTALLAVGITLSMGNACKGNPVKPKPAVAMTQAQADKLARDLVLALNNGLRDCRARIPNPNNFGTFPVNVQCGATTTCPGGGTIRMSLAMTGQVVVGQFGASFNIPMSGSQNMVDWACAIGGSIVSGNPTVSLNGEQLGNATALQVRLDHSGQIIYGVRGEGQLTCGVSLRTTETLTQPMRTSGSICGHAIAPF